MLGYYRQSLRDDEGQILAALDLRSAGQPGLWPGVPAAIAAAQRAALLAATLHLEKVAMRNRELLQLYRQGQPFHEKKGQ